MFQLKTGLLWAKTHVLVTKMGTFKNLERFLILKLFVTRNSQKRNKHSCQILF